MKISDSQLEESLNCALDALRNAHEIVEGSIEGRPPKADLVESYYGCMNGLAEELGLKGKTIKGLFDEYDGGGIEVVP